MDGKLKGEPKLHPRGGFFGPWPFTILKSSHQDLSNEGLNFILSSPEIGHKVAQIWLCIFSKLPKIRDFGLLNQSQNMAGFWICKVLTHGTTNVKIDHALTFDMPKIVFS